MSRFSELLRAAVSEFLPIKAGQAESLEAHYELMMRWNRRTSLTTISSLEEAVVRHYAESLFLAAALPADVGSVADLGSGAGFPGLPLAVVRQNSQVSLVESNARKCVFLREASRHLANVKVCESRAEKIDDHFDAAISRAVNWKGSVPVLARLAERVFLLLGQDDAEALASSSDAFEWRRQRLLPWGRRRVLLEGSRR